MISAANKKINRIVLAGMGGSNLGARIITSAFPRGIKSAAAH